MKNLLYKELKLAMHPTTIIFLMLSAMLLIPNYPYLVIFFYSCLGVFFVCLTGRENSDIFFSMLLPVRKKDIVKARIGFVVAVQLVQMIVAIPFAFIRSLYTELPGNQVGIDANTAMFGFAFIVLAAFNFAFFSRYYKNTNSVGRAFTSGCIWLTVVMIVLEVSIHAVPFIRDCIDTPDPQFLQYKLIILGIGAVIYALSTLLTYKKSVKSFEQLDL